MTQTIVHMNSSQTHSRHKREEMLALRDHLMQKIERIQNTKTKQAKVLLPASVHKIICCMSHRWHNQIKDKLMCTEDHQENENEFDNK